MPYTQLINSADDALFERNLTQPEPCVRLYPLLPDLNTTGYCLRQRRHDRILPLLQSVGVKIFRFRLGLRYEGAYSAPQTLAGFKVREGKGRQGEREGSGEDGN